MNHYPILHRRGVGVGKSVPGWLVLHALLGCAIVILPLIGIWVAGPQFLQAANIRVILVAGAISGLLALAQTLVLIVREIDLAIGATLVVAPLLAVYAADQISYSFVGRGLLVGMTGTLLGGWWLIVILCLLFATLIGVAMGFLVAFLKIPSFVVTIGFGFIMIGSGYVLSQGTPVFFQNVKDSDFLGNRFIFNVIPWSFLCFMVVAGILMFLMLRTRLGPRLYATGGNPRAAVLAGIHVKWWTLCAYSISGLIIGIASVLLISRMQGVDIGQSANFALASILVSILGGVGVMGGEGRISGVVLATIAFAILSQILSALGLNFYDQMVVSGAVVLLFTAVSKRADSARLRRLKGIEV